MSNRPELNPSIIEVIIIALITAPESQLSPRLKKESAIFFSISRTPTQTYDYIQRISEQPITEASPFVKSLCAMERFYHRPAE